MKNYQTNPQIETRRDGFFVDTLLDSDPETRQIEAERFVDDLLDVIAPGGDISEDETIDLYTYISTRKELEDFSTRGKRGYSGKLLGATIV